ncbi:sap-like protein bp-73 [Fagus crenata]
MKAVWAVQARKTLLLSQSFLNLAETADGPSLFDFQRDFPRLTVSSIRSDGDGNRRCRPPQRSSASRRASEEDENETAQSSNGKKSNSSNQEEIIALFRRIQSAISKDESVNTKRNTNLSDDTNSPESILEVLRKSRKQVKGDADKTSNKEGDKVLTRRRGVPKKEQGVKTSPPVADSKSTRLPSKFVKKSPIPSPSTSRERILELNNEALQARAGSELKLPRIEEMKLTELKELAKSRGIKGYSKLKKIELVELLRS